MNLDFRFAVISDPHIALPNTIWDNPLRFHLVEHSIPALEVVIQQLSHEKIDFLLLPGDLTQHGETENHQWLSNRLAQLPYPVYVIPGNHDVPYPHRHGTHIGFADFPYYYETLGYSNPKQMDYSHEVLPGVKLIALNSNHFDQSGQQLGRLTTDQLLWLQEVLTSVEQELVLVMIHHNVCEHLPGQTNHPLGRRYMLENARELLDILRSYGVQLVFTGHLHVQDVASCDGIFDITTGSLVTYPHPYRIIKFQRDSLGRQLLQINSKRVMSLPNCPELQAFSRNWMGDRSHPFIMRLLTDAPLHLSIPEAEALAPDLRNFWAEIAQGDSQFSFPHFPKVAQVYFESFGAVDAHGNEALIDNQTTLTLR